ncbi:LysM peptidoglycan-binding domain-containing protein [Clostridium algoriphilum]|uniref:muramidase family protein n=1 Tax=Clostridium algoriphilum TaxID=198347 RepID=UPI001CF27EFE|nr:LysM peptidoglycan-binding domain-containing protein [Clostridium algoriphilum]MCB2293076.1 LysM peptidoglycan-binding domain-containing protein [Clostridium algoriphilum]
MNMKKGIISISTIVVVILGVFFAVRYIGGRENVSNNKFPSDSIAQSNNTILENNNETSTNTQAKSANEMDATYTNDKTNVGIYTVKVDDTVFSIVKKHMPSHDEGQVVEYIKNRNNMNNSYKIAVGQKIVIPYETSIKTSTTVSTRVSTNSYSVKKQDTLYSIAKNKMPSYNVKQAIKMLKESNKITNENSIKDGTVLNIPK